jgi:imidazolonepropionase-like amidohydrolase
MPTSYPITVGCRAGFRDNADVAARPRISIAQGWDSDPKLGFNAAHHAAVTLDAGFTTVRDVGAAVIPRLFSHCGLPLPKGRSRDRILCVGAILSPTGGHGQTYGYRHDVCACVQSTSGICDGVDECRRAVRRQVSHGADAVKFVATGGVPSDIKAGLDQQFTDDEIRSIIETTHRLGRREDRVRHGYGCRAARTERA